ncbi:hypothetical protein RZA67_01390 [Stenotrophomonas sp. C3(2023)]|uniref:hypothetical protein n=1 Tax=Stenotrophomonas sp. C3(2023) TaxID=3080277 RepID=UPI00293C32D9|nr:hypothetical protein [Stenotrophomonas sp. C3(2023)]MDV3467391.1 hypothetical protein [Stenotrophomonas sp. C3(2023)]
MKRMQVLPCAIAMALLGASAAQAAEITPTPLMVQGTIDVPACTVVVDNNGLYEIGELGPTDVKTGTSTSTLTPITKKWTVSCEGDTFMSFSVTDNRKGTASTNDNSQFGMGLVNGTGKLGYYSLAMKNPTVDTVASHVFATNRKNAGDNKGASTVVRTDGFVMGWAAPTSATQQIGRVFAVDMEATPVLAGSQTMNGPIIDDVSLSGSLTFDFAYGL